VRGGFGVHALRAEASPHADSCSTWQQRLAGPRRSRMMQRVARSGAALRRPRARRTTVRRLQTDAIIVSTRPEWLLGIIQFSLTLRARSRNSSVF